MGQQSLKEVLIGNLKFVQEKSGLDFSAEIQDITEADDQIFGILTRLANKIQIHPHELLDFTFHFSYGTEVPWCS